jgi:transcriptional regulator with XRE-family HTH domain
MVGVEIDGRKLRRLREMRLWTREELGEKSGVSPDQIGRIERGTTRAPQMRTVRGLVAALEVEPTALMAEDPPVSERGTEPSAEALRAMSKELEAKQRGGRGPKP